MKKLLLPMLTAAALGGWSTAPSFAAEDGADPAAVQVAAMPLDELKIRLKPYTKTQLKDIAVAWIRIVQATEVRIADAVVDGDSAEQAAASEDRDALSAKTKAVLAELEAKGGDPNEHQTFLASLTPNPPAMDKDASAILSYVGDWLTSADGGVRWLLNVIKFLVVILAFKVASGFVGRIVLEAMSRMKNASSLLRDFFVNSVKKVTMFIGFVIGLSFLGVDIGPFLAAMGAAGFVIGFALQGTLSNFASGVMILIYRPYDIGDAVTAAGITGKVEAMSLVSTTVLTPDNQVIVIPNSEIWGSVITNVNARDTRRVDMVFGIGYEDDIEKAQQILEELCAAHPKTLDVPAPSIRLTELADSSVNFIARPWAKTEDRWDVYCDLQRQVKERFDEENITLPYPQTDVHVHGLEGRREVKV